jgi:hypothetical protein
MTSDYWSSELPNAACKLLERAASHVDGLALVDGQSRSAIMLIKRGFAERMTSKVLVVTDAGLAEARRRRKAKP